MTFDYLMRTVVEGQLDVDDIGSNVILGRNDFGEEHYLITRTDMGYTEMIVFGPVTPDIDILSNNVNMSYQRFDFNQGKIERLIDKFLNDTKKCITQASVVEYEDIRDFIKESLNKILP